MAHRLVTNLVLGLGAAALGAGCVFDEVPDELACEDGKCDDLEKLPLTVTKYDYRVDLSTQNARATVQFIPDQTLGCVDMPYRAADPESVTINGKVVGAQTGGDRLKACGQPVSAGATSELAVDLPLLEETDELQIGFTISTDSQGRPFQYALSWVHGCDMFGPCDTATDRFPRYQFTIDHPSNTSALCPGSIVRSPGRTECRFDLGGGPTYSTFAFFASQSWSQSSLGSWGGVATTLFDVPGSGLAADLDPDMHSRFMQMMQGLFGAYPYGSELRVATGPTQFAGFEHPGTILLSENLRGDSLRHIMHHEIAHMWAGNETTLRGAYDFVWKESMAEYLSYVFEDEQVGGTVAGDTLRDWKSAAQFASFFPVPSNRPSMFDFFGDVYGAGPMILFRQLEVMFGRPAVLDAIASLLKGGEKAISVDDVRVALEQSTGADLDTYFDRWLIGSGKPNWPRVKVSHKKVSGGQVEVKIQQLGNETFGCAFFVELRGSAGQSKLVPFNLGVNGQGTATSVATVPFEVTSTVLDPDVRCLVFDESAVVPSSRPDRMPIHRLPFAPAAPIDDDAAR